MTPDGSVDAAVDARADVVVLDAADAGAGTVASLAPGEVVELPVTAGVAAVRLATPTGNERFVLVLASTRFVEMDDPASYQAAARVDGFAPAPTPVTGCSLDSARWRAMTLPAETPPSGTAPAIGAERSFRFPNFTTGMIEVLRARVVAVSEHAVVWVDATNPTTVEMGVVTELLRGFDATIVPRERAVFGMESDVDGDGRVSLVFSSRTAMGGADAFFWSCDLLSKSGCGGSNQVEALYLTPLSLIRPPYNTVPALSEIVSHELGHVIHYGRKVLRNRLTDWPDAVYMQEAFGGLAQDTIGYQFDSLRAAKLALDQIDRFSLSDLLVDRAGKNPSRDAAQRGGGYLFVRWLYDRAGGDEALPDGSVAGRGGPALVRTLLDARESVAGALPTATGAALGDLAMDFYTALAASNREEGGGVAASNGCFRYGAVTTDPATTRPRGADLYSTFEGMMARGPAVQAIASADGRLRYGGVEYLALEATAGAPELGATVRVSTDAAPRVRVLRVR